MPSLSHAWWNDEWNFRKDIALDLTPAGGDIAVTATDVPVLLRLSIANFSYFGDVKGDGSDFRLVAGDDKTPLKFHVERFDAANQMAFIWVKAPQLTGGTNSDRIHLYYGNPDAPAAGDAAGTYDANQALVLHFGEAEGQTPRDSSAYGNHASDSTATLAPASLIGGGAQFSGTDSISVPATSSLRLVPGKGLTLSAWVRVESEQSEARVLSLEDGAKSLVLGIRGLTPFAALADGVAAPVDVAAAATLAAGQWHHLAVAVGNDRLAVFLDGVEQGAATVSIPEIGGTLYVGGSPAGGYLTGAVDEVQASTVPRPAEWIRAQARSQGQDALLVGYGNDAQREAEHVNYLAVTMRNVTVDGWIVIVILAVMFLISVLIMVGKTVMLLRIRRGNREFLADFQKAAGDLTALDRDEDEDEEDALSGSALMPALDGGGDKYRFSTLYRLYHHGAQEVRQRTAASTAGARATTPSLSAQSVEAVRAAMDATLVRLVQKLQSKMVLLTIAISGGPFLGLLGTVVGVMITFAAIAASGDVNVNAIAPGIAAALAATVAGLAVAIPALFGYNWLNSLIKEINADMRVFVDEFVARVAERFE